MCMSVVLVCLGKVGYVHVSTVACVDKKRDLDPLELELPGVGTRY